MLKVQTTQLDVHPILAFGHFLEVQAQDQRASKCLVRAATSLRLRGSVGSYGFAEDVARPESAIGVRTYGSGFSAYNFGLRLMA